MKGGWGRVGKKFFWISDCFWRLYSSNFRNVTVYVTFSPRSLLSNPSGKLSYFFPLPPSLFLCASALLQAEAEIPPSNSYLHNQNRSSPVASRDKAPFFQRRTQVRVMGWNAGGNPLLSRTHTGILPLQHPHAEIRNRGRVSLSLYDSAGREAQRWNFVTTYLTSSTPVSLSNDLES